MPVPSVSSTTSEQPAAAPDARLAEHRAVGVVVDRDRQPDALGHHLVEGDVVQRRIGRLDRHPGPRVERAGDAEADRLDAVAHGGPDLLDRVGDHLHESVLVETVDRTVGTVMDREVRVDRAGQELGAAEVDADDASLEHAGHDTAPHHGRPRRQAPIHPLPIPQAPAVAT